METKGKFPRVIVNKKADNRRIRSADEKAAVPALSSLRVSLARWETQALDLMLAMIPEVRESKVEQIRKRIAVDDYHVSAEEIADKILDAHSKGPLS